MNADNLVELINEFNKKGNISSSEMGLLRIQGTQLGLTEKELDALIAEVIAEEKIRQEMHIAAEEKARKIVQENAELEEQRLKERIIKNQHLKERIKVVGPIVLAVPVLIAIVFFGIEYFSQKNSWDSVKEANTYESYQKHLEKYPDGTHIQEATALQENAAWSEATDQNTIESYDRYLALYPTGKYNADAITKKEESFWMAAKAANTLDSYHNYIVNYQNGKYKNLLWDLISPLIAEPKKVGQPNFHKITYILGNLELPQNILQSNRYKLASGLQFYVDGNLDGAIPIFEEIAANDPNSQDGKLSKQILVSPAQRKLTYNWDDFHFKGTWSNSGGPNGLLIRLVGVTVGSSSLSVLFSVTPNNNKDCLIYATKNINEQFGSHCETLYLIDNTGKKLYTTSGFIGGRQEEFNSCTKRICLEPGERVNISAEFPMVSRGATAIRFVSPNPDNAGHQSDWHWDGIIIKPGPFD